MYISIYLSLSLASDVKIKLHINVRHICENVLNYVIFTHVDDVKYFYIVYDTRTSFSGQCQLTPLQAIIQIV